MLIGTIVKVTEGYFKGQFGHITDIKINPKDGSLIYYISIIGPYTEPVKLGINEITANINFGVFCLCMKKHMIKEDDV